MPGNPMRTDVHTHAFHPAVAGKALARLVALGFSPSGTGVVDDLLLRAAAAGLDRVVVHSLAVTGNQTPPANTFALALARREKTHPAEPEVMAFGSIHPDYPRWREELDRLERAGIKGIKVHPNFQNMAFDDPRMFALMDAVEKRFRVMCHVGCEKPLEANPASPYKLRTLIERFPDVTIIAAHMGGYADGEAALDALAGTSVWLDTSGTAAMGSDALRRIVARHPADRVLFGSDYPLYDPAREREEQPERLGISAQDMETILHNADRLLAA